LEEIFMVLSINIVTTKDNSVLLKLQFGGDILKHEQSSSLNQHPPFLDSEILHFFVVEGFVCFLFGGGLY
jgi:hypothetical protein